MLEEYRDLRHAPAALSRAEERRRRERAVELEEHIDALYHRLAGKLSAPIDTPPPDQPAQSGGASAFGPIEAEEPDLGPLRSGGEEQLPVTDQPSESGTATGASGAAMPTGRTQGQPPGAVLAPERAGIGSAPAREPSGRDRAEAGPVEGTITSDAEGGPLVRPDDSSGVALGRPGADASLGVCVAGL
jgi:hypothetical protein